MRIYFCLVPFAFLLFILYGFHSIPDSPTSLLRQGPSNRILIKPENSQNAAPTEPRMAPTEPRGTPTNGGVATTEPPVTPTEPRVESTEQTVASIEPSEATTESVVGSPSPVVVYDLSQPCHDDHKCIRTPLFHICTHEPDVDEYISKSLINEGYWERAQLFQLKKMLLSDPEMGLLDIGANIGVFTLLAASLDKPVVAVEGRPMHVQMLHHSLLANNFKIADVVLLQNLITDRRGDVKFYINPKNQGGSGVAPSADTESLPEVYPSILFDDITDHVPFTKAVLKMDIENSEVMAFDHSERLFDKVFIPFILMEWTIGGVDPGGSVRVIDILQKRGYELFTIHFRKITEINLLRFPDNVIWKHKSINFPK